MSHNALIHAGGWSPGYVVTQADFVAIDTLLFKSLNADDGGTWAPAAAINIGGAGLALSGANHHVLNGGTLTVDGGATLAIAANAAVTSGGTTSWRGIYKFAPAAEVTFLADSIVTVTTDKFYVDGTLEVRSGGTLKVDAGTDVIVGLGSSWTFHGDISLAADGSLSVLGSGGSIVLTDGIMSVGSGATLTCVSGSIAAFQGTTTFGSAADITVSAPMKMSGAGRIRKRRVAGVNADHTYVVADGTIIDIPTQSAVHTYRIANTGAGEGDTMLFTMLSDATAQNGNGIDLVRDSDSSTIGIQLRKVSASSDPVWMEIFFDGTRWQPGMHGALFP